MIKVWNGCVVLAMALVSLNNPLFAQQSPKLLDVNAKIAAVQATHDKKEKLKQLDELTEYYFSKKNLDSLIVFGKEIIKVAKELNDESEVAKNQLMLSRAYLEKADVVNSERYWQPASVFFNDKKDIRRYARAKYIEGALQQHKQSYDAAAASFSEIIVLYNDKDGGVEDYTVYGAYTGLFGTYTLAQQFDKALKTTDKYFSFIEKKYPSEIGSAHLLLGNLYNLTYDQERAAVQLEKARNFYAVQNNDAAVASINMQLGMALSGLKKTDSAELLLNSSRDYFKKIGHSGGESTTLYALSAIAMGKSQFEKAIELLDEAERISPPNNPIGSYLPLQRKKIILKKLMSDSVKIATSAVAKAALQAATNDFEKEFKAIAAQKTGFVSIHELIESYANLAGADALLNNYERAYNNYKISTSLKDSIFGTSKMRKMNDAEASINIEREKAKIQLAEATKLLELQKAMELEALHHEFERKHALANTEAERKQLLFEEEIKRKAIEEEYALKREAATAKYEQEKALAKANEEKEKALSLAELRKSNNARNISLLSAGLLLASAGVFGYGYSQKRKDNRKIAEEKKRSDDLLLNILPAEIAHELKNNGHSVAQQHPEVSVLFTDFVNFTQTSEKLGVEELVNELNINFTAFDRIMERHGLEKIKTIGDAYLAVSGLPVSNEEHAQNAVRAALEILSFVEKRKNEVPYGLDIRIGINSGALIAGIIGVKKFAYDIWGDTVNIAARMEQSGMPSKVNISETTYTLVKEEFDCVYRGKIDAKNKGELDMYFVNYLAKN